MNEHAHEGEKREENERVRPRVFTTGGFCIEEGMAGSSSAESSALLDAAEGSSSASTQPKPGDWEVLSMSTMSASTLGLPPQRGHESDIIADAEDRSSTEKDLSDASSEPFPASQQEGHDFMDKCSSEKDMENKNVQPHDALEGEEGSAIQEESIPAAFSKKKIRVFLSKHQVFNWQPRSRKYNAMLSIALVAAVVGIAFIGHRLRRERNVNLQLRSDLAAKEEKLSDMMYQVNRLKETMTGRRRVGVSRNSFF